MIVFTLHPGKVKPIALGHPWVFPKAIAHRSGTPQNGELIEVRGPNGLTIGYGVYNSVSLYQVRMLAYAHEGFNPDLVSIIKARLNRAWQLRLSLNLPNPPLNTAFRWCNSEGDGLSGLTIDVFDSIAVVSSSAYWVEQQQDNIRLCIESIMKPSALIWRPQAKPLEQDGWTAALDAIDIDLKTSIQEHGVAFEIDFRNTQKTGHFLDQRDNHRRIAELSAGKRVLDLYCYTGGFALHAAKAGAVKVTAIDSSQPAIAQAKRNAELNNLSAITFIQDDATHYLSRAGDYDLIILDPPKLVPRRTQLKKASGLYHHLHKTLFENMKPGSLLLTCNCSSAMTLPLFLQVIQEAAVEAKRSCRILGTFGPGLDHTMLASFPEGNYLQAVLVSV